MAIQDRRGAWENFDPTKLLPGEWADVLSGDPSASDGRSVYKCFAAGVVKRMATYEDMEENIDSKTADKNRKHNRDGRISKISAIKYEKLLIRHLRKAFSDSKHVSCVESLLISGHERCDQKVTLVHAALHKLMGFQYFQQVVVFNDRELLKVFSCLKADKSTCSKNGQ